MSMLQVDSKQCISTILRLAWSELPLQTIRGLVETAIAGLLQLEVIDVLGRAPSDAELASANNPLQDALSTCCDELREGCGMPLEVSLARRIHRKRELGADWSVAYEFALGRYRDAAASSLQLAFGSPR